MVSLLSFYSDDLSLNTVKDYNFCVMLFLKRIKINNQRPRLAQFNFFNLINCY